MNFLKNGNFAEKKLEPWEPTNHSSGGQYPIPSEGDIHTVTDFNAIRLSPGGVIGQWLDIGEVGDNNLFVVKVKAQKAGQPRTTPIDPEHGQPMKSAPEVMAEFADLAKDVAHRNGSIGYLAIAMAFYENFQLVSVHNDRLDFSELREWYEHEFHVTGPANTVWTSIRVSFLCPPHTTTYPGYLHTDIYVTNLEANGPS